MIKKNKEQSAKNKVNSKLGFTLIELLIVIAVLGGLAAMFMTSFPGAQKKARDARRRSDIKQYQTAMEVYANKNNGQYFTVATTNIVTQCGSAPRPLVLPSCPDDPVTSTHYQIISNTTQYILFAQLETLDDTVSPAQIQYFYVCSSGKSGLKRTPAPTLANCS